MSGNKPNQNGKDDKTAPRMGRGHGPGGMGGVEKAKDARGTLIRLLSYLGEYRMTLILVSALTVGSTLLSLAGPYLQGVAIDQFINTGDKVGLVRIITILAGTYVVGTLASMGAGWVMASISQKSLMKMRKELFEHMQTLSLSYFDKKPAGDLMSRLTNDVDAIAAALAQNVTQLIRNAITLVGILVMMFSLNVWLALASLIVFPIMIALTALVGGKTRDKFRALQKSMGMLNSTMQETLSGQRVVIAFDQQDSVNKKFNKVNLSLVFEPTKAVSPIIIGNTTKLASANHLFKLNIITSIPTSVIALRISSVTFWANAAAIASTSFVSLLIRSPAGLLSK